MTKLAYMWMYSACEWVPFWHHLESLGLPLPLPVTLEALSFPTDHLCVCGLMWAGQKEPFTCRNTGSFARSCSVQGRQRQIAEDTVYVVFLRRACSCLRERPAPTALCLGHYQCVERYYTKLETPGHLSTDFYGLGEISLFLASFLK